MSKVITFFISAITTLLLCMVAGCAIHESKASTPWIDTRLPQPVIAELAPPPGHILIENDKILRYQLRHHYNLRCGENTFAAISYSSDVNVTSIQLLAGQTIQTAQLCIISKANPLHAVYLYDRTEPPLK